MQDNNADDIYTSAILSGPICAMLGLQWQDVLDEAGLRVDGTRQGGMFLCGNDYTLIWDTIVTLSDAPDIAQYLGKRMAQGPAVPVLFAMSSAPNFETGLARMARYKHLFGPMRFDIDADAATYTLRVIPAGLVTELPPTFASAQVIFLHAKAKSLSSRAFKPLAVSVPLPAEERASLGDLFEMEPSYGLPMLSYAASDVRIPFISQNDALWAATEHDLQTQSLIVSGESPMTHRVRASLLEALATTDPTIAHVTARLNISKSTLQRRLREEGTSFQDILDTTRLELAMRYLKSSFMSNQQIAHLLGYRDTSAFQRAFRKWTGTTPQKLRRGGPEPPERVPS
ncbi:MAG: helix-turn-helix domain-containing protein [Pseudomonadota bacterium]